MKPKNKPDFCALICVYDGGERIELDIEPGLSPRASVLQKAARRLEETFIASATLAEHTRHKDDLDKLLERNTLDKVMPKRRIRRKP